MTGRKNLKPGNRKTDVAPDSVSEHEPEMLTKQQRRQKGKSLSLPYIPTERELEILYKQQAREEAEPPVPRLKIVRKFGAPTIVPDHPDQSVGYALLQEAIGTCSREFLGTILVQLGHVCSRNGTIDPVQLDFMFSVVRDIRPPDQIVAMLAIQMAAVHWLMIFPLESGSRLSNLGEQEIADRMFNRLTRTFAMQIEALKRYRTGGEQKVTVQHVSVNEGGQAIVGNVTQDVRESVPQKRADKPLALTNSREQPMPIIEERRCERESVPARRRQKDDVQSSS
jgi:hypothetical protein